MIDLKEYNERELSLIVFNTELFYNLIDNKPALISKLQSRYQYSKKQLSRLLKDIEDYKVFIKTEFARYKVKI